MSSIKERRTSSNEYFTTAEEKAHDRGFKLGLTDEVVRGMAEAARDLLKLPANGFARNAMRKCLEAYNAAVAEVEK